MLCLTLHDSKDRLVLSFTVSWSLLRFTSTVNHSSFASPSPLAFNLSQHQGLFQWVGSWHWSFNFSISPSSEYLGLISFRNDWFDILGVQGTLKSLLQHHNYTYLEEHVRWDAMNLKLKFRPVTQSCSTLGNPMDCSMPSLPVHHQLPELLKLMSIESVMPSNHLILCHPLLLLPSIFPSIRVFSNESALRTGGKSIGV